MGKAKRDRRKADQIDKRSDIPTPRSRWKTFLIPATIGCIAGMAIAASIIAIDRARATPTPLPNTANASTVSLGSLFTMSPKQLAGVDVALMNLLCAQGLPGAEGLDIPKSLATLDEWTKRVKFETERHLYRVTDPKYADHYQRSEARYRAEMLCQVLQEDLGVHYNMERVENISFTNSKDLFLNGLIADKNGGTCMSMPVAYTAIARRLGYPVKLVEAKAHLYCRWEGKGPDGKEERFNFDGAGSGFGVHDDSYYKTWPRLISDDEVARGEYLKSLSPGEELAAFLSARGHCLLDNGHVRDAQAVYAQAHRLNPASRDYFGFFLDSVKRELPRPTFASSAWESPEPPRGRNIDAELQQVQAINEANRRRQEEQWQRAVPNAPSPYQPPSPFGPAQGRP